jgi:hypothetical protein
MKNSYTEVFDLNAADGSPILELRGLEGERAWVRVHPFWSEYVKQVDLVLQLPTVRTSPFPWDRGIHGHVVQFVGDDPRNPRGAERFCHPRLRSAVADEIAFDGRPSARERVHDTPLDQWGWRWETFYDRLGEALVDALFGPARERYQGRNGGLSCSQRRPTERLCRSYLQRAVSQLVNGGPDQSGLPITDPARLAFQMLELELGYPDVPSDNLLFETLKLRFIEYVDQGACVLHTGKSDVGRHVMRFRKEAPISHVTGQPVPDAVLSRNPFGCHTNPLRDHREGRALPTCFDFEEPEGEWPLIRAKGVPALPASLRPKVKPVLCAFIDLVGENVHPVCPEQVSELRALGVSAADLMEGEQVSGDALLVTPSGRRRLQAYQTRSDLLTHEEFQEQFADLESEEGFRFQTHHELIDLLDDGTPIFRSRYRTWFERPLPLGIDKLKLAVGGIKAVVRPTEQYWTRTPDGAFLPIDLIVSEKTMLGKGAQDALLYALAGMGGLEEVDPSWSMEELCHRISHALRGQGYDHWAPDDDQAGRLPLYAGRQVAVDGTGKPLPPDTVLLLEQAGFPVESGWNRVQVAECVVGPVPVMRAVETEARQSRASRGVSVDLHARNLIAQPFPECPEVRRSVADIGRFVQTYLPLLTD